MQNDAAIKIFHHVGKPAIVQKLQRVACNKLHIKPWHKVAAGGRMQCSGCYKVLATERRRIRLP